MFLSANRFIELPVCSYAAQKKITKNTTMKSAMTRFRSSPCVPRTVIVSAAPITSPMIRPR